MASRLRSSFTQVAGIRLHWVETGESDEKPPVVLLHGLADCHLTWSSVAAELGRDRRVFVLDLPGHGLSERAHASYELSWYAEVVAGWLDVLGATRVDLVGHSYGGGISQLLLLERRDRIRRLALVAPGGFGREVAFFLRIASIPHIVERYGQPFMGACTRLVLRVASKTAESDYVGKVSAMNQRDGSARVFARTVRGAIGLRGQRKSFFSRAHELRSLPPMALFWGDSDSIIPVTQAEAFTRAVEGVRFTLFESCQHYPHHDHPERFVRVLREFLDEASLAPARIRGGGQEGGQALPSLLVHARR